MQEFENKLEKKWDYDMETPEDSEVPIEKLKKFLKPEDTLIFYGGEPLMKINKIMEIIDNVDCHFMIQTNGMLLDKLPTKYLMKLDKMLVSIDGTKERDNWGKGIVHYDKIISNLKDVRARGYTNEIVARMVISGGDIYNQVMHLVGLINKGLFDSIHWQIDAGFYKFDFNEEKFSKFVKEYNDSIDELLDFWITEIGRGVEVPPHDVPGTRTSNEVNEKRGKVWRFYPFLGILNRLMGWDKDKGLPCGAGVNNFSINTKGDLSACPIMNSVKNLYCGNIEKGITTPRKISGCDDCSYKNICGGRCLYWKEANLWPKTGNDLICDTIKHLIDGVREKAVPKVKEAIKERKVKKEDFDFEKYFGPEIIP